jgi:hypothetical protein
MKWQDPLSVELNGPNCLGGQYFLIFNHTWDDIYIYICIHMHIYIYINICIYTYIYIYIHMVIFNHTWDDWLRLPIYLVLTINKLRSSWNLLHPLENIMAPHWKIQWNVIGKYPLENIMTYHWKISWKPVFQWNVIQKS